MSIEKNKKQAINEDELDSVSGGMNFRATNAANGATLRSSNGPAAMSTNQNENQNFGGLKNFIKWQDDNLGMVPDMSGVNAGGLHKPGAPGKGHGILDNTEEIM